VKGSAPSPLIGAVRTPAVTSNIARAENVTAAQGVEGGRSVPFPAPCPTCDLWAGAPVYVEIWREKDALAGVLIEETEPYDVPLMVARGYASISFLHSAAKAIEAKGKPAYIYHFGDLDPSGVDAARDIEAKLRRYAPGAEIHFERPAVTREQVERWNLPTRPTKMTDTRAKKFVGTSVELDAIPAGRLRGLVRESVERHIDKQHLNLLRIAEASERDLLTKWASTLKGAAS
jgi:hypothetical protein